jgi:2-oxoglutarate ferredoxin oxidoreductase subunit beta
MEHRGFAFLNVMSPCVTWRGDEQFKMLKAKLAFLPPDHDPTDRTAALRYTRETDVLTTGVLYDVRQPSLCERIEEIRVKARHAGVVSTTAEILTALSPPI